MYKFIKKKQIKQINKLENEFEYISNYIKNKLSNFNWWIFEISRLDFRPWGGLNKKNYFEISNLNKNSFFFNFFKDFVLILLFILKSIIQKKKKIYYKNVFFFEDIQIDKTPKNFYFKDIFNLVKNKIIIIASLEKSKDRNIITLFSLLTFNEKLTCFFTSIYSMFKLNLLLRSLVNENKINKFWIDYFYLKENLKKLYINNLIIKFSKKNIFCKNLIMPYEEKTIERALLKNNYKNKINIYGVCINPQHNLASFLKNFKKIKIPRTENYLFCGPSYRKYFYQLNRQNVLSKTKNDCLGSYKSKIVNIKFSHSNTFLVLLSHIDEFYNLIKYQKENKKLKKYEFLIRPYPHANDRKNIENYIIQNKISNFKLSKNKLLHDIQKSFAVIFSATSAGIEAINHGRIGIWSNLSETGINPLFNDVKYFYPSFNSNQLIRVMNFLKEKEYIDQKKILKKQQSFCKNVYSKVNFSIINKYFYS